MEHVFAMTNLRNLVAISATAALVAIGQNVIAQDDLDDLLKDLGDAPVAAEPADAEDSAPGEDPVVEEEASVDEEPVAEAEAEESAAEEESVAEAEEPVAGEEPVAEAEEPAAGEEPVAEAEGPATEAEESAADEEPVAEAEEPVAEAEEPVADEEPVAEAEEPAAKPEEVLETINELAAEEEAPVAEEPAADEEPAAEAEDSKAEEPEEVAEAAEPEPAAEEPEEPAEVASTAAPAEESAANNSLIPEKDKELIEQLAKTRELSLQAYALQAQREHEEAERCMASEEFLEAAKHYALAVRLLNDSPRYAEMRKECEQGIADSLYRAAMQEDAMGRRERAMKPMDKAVARRHPKARRQLQSWKAAGDPDANKTDISEIKTLRNEDEYKAQRAKNNQHLKRAHQYISSRQLDKAADECGLVLVTDPYNQEALRIMKTIQKKRHTILMQERESAREGMMADVDKAWRPVYAVDAREVDDVKETRPGPVDPKDPERSAEQTIIKRMKEMRLPAISFKPPATIIDAVEFFRTASKDYDRPEIPLEQRGFNFFLKPPEAIRATAAVEEESSGFAAEDDEGGAGAQSGVPVIPMITASDISFYEALKLVCESVEYKFKVQNSMVVVMHKDAAIEEMVTRSYPVLSSFMERMDSASSDMKEMRSGGFGGASNASRRDDGEESQERDWKEFFSLLGVKWPEGSSIMYIKTIGKLRVKNTYENLAELEQALTEMNADPKLIEIEARFVEVCQDDLNSLGFEWILNSDYTLGVGRHVGQALGLRRGTWGSFDGSAKTTTSWDSQTLATAGQENVQNIGGVTTTTTTTVPVSQTAFSSTKTVFARSNGAGWIRDRTPGRKNIGISSMGGDSELTGGANRYLDTLSNHISGEGRSTNDKFMKVNAFLGAADLSMILHMLSQRSDTDLLSAPKVLTRPGEEAVIKVVTEYIYPTDYDVQLQSSSSSGGYGSGGSQSAILAVVEPQSFTMREVGVILDVTPTLTDDGNLIDLKLNTQVVDEPTWKNYGMRIPFTGNSSSLQSFAGIGEILTGLSAVLTTLGTGLNDTMRATFAESAVNSATTALDSLSATSSGDNMTYYDAPMEQPFFHVRSIDSTVSVYPGATIVMGGLITEARKAMDDKIPFLGDIPFVGRLFRSHSEQTSKRNLLIFVTTRLVDVRGREVPMGSLDVKDTEAKSAPSDEED